MIETPKHSPLHRALLSGAMGAILVLALGCRGTSDGTSGSGTNGTVNVHMVADPSINLYGLDLNIQRVDLQGDRGWTTVDNANVVVHAMNLIGDNSATLANGFSLSPGHYSAMRVVFGNSNQVSYDSSMSYIPTLPTGLQSGVMVSLSLDVTSGVQSDVFLGVDCNQSVQPDTSGGSPAFVLYPVLWANDYMTTGSISGKLVDASTQAPLAGVAVMAEVQDGYRIGVVRRTAFTASDGTYTLGQLPLGQTYNVVSMPVVGSTVYNAAASGGLTLDGNNPDQTCPDLSFQAASSVGEVDGDIVHTQGTPFDIVELMQYISVDSGTSPLFVVQTNVATLTNSGELYAFTWVPSNSILNQYATRATWVTYDSTGALSGTSKVSSTPLIVSANTTTVVGTITF